VAVRGTRGAISWSPAYEGEKDVLNVCSDQREFGGSPRRALTFELSRVKGYSGVMGLDYVRDSPTPCRGIGSRSSAATRGSPRSKLLKPCMPPPPAGGG